MQYNYYYVAEKTPQTKPVLFFFRIKGGVVCQTAQETPHKIFKNIQKPRTTQINEAAKREVKQEKRAKSVDIYKKYNTTIIKNNIIINNSEKNGDTRLANNKNNT